MVTKKTETTSSSIASDSGQKAVAKAAQRSPPPAALGVADSGRSKGEAIGGAIGHVIGVGTDVVIGAVKGGIAAGMKAIGPIDATAEHEFWRAEYQRRHYFTPGTAYEQYGPAYQFGWESYASHNGPTSFDQVESQLSRNWEFRRGKSLLSWSHAKNAARDAWQRAEQAACGASCSSA